MQQATLAEISPAPDGDDHHEAGEVSHRADPRRVSGLSRRVPLGEPPGAFADPGEPPARPPLGTLRWAPRAPVPVPTEAALPTSPQVPALSALTPSPRKAQRFGEGVSFDFSFPVATGSREDKAQRAGSSACASRCRWLAFLLSFFFFSSFFIGACSLS